MNFKEKIKEIIAEIKLPDGSPVSFMVSEIIEKENRIGFSLDVTSAGIATGEKIRGDILKRWRESGDPKDLSIVLTSGSAGGKPKKLIEKVKKIVLISSGKGGVGKSTVTSIIARSLAEEGRRVGIMDADIYGSSIPGMFGIKEKSEIREGRIIPATSGGIKIVSIGLLVKENEALAWRGPMASKALFKLLSLTSWGELDYLLVDTPPGTGDVHISLLENYNIDSVIMVTTPQRIATADVERAINLYRKFGVKIEGVIENMSYFTDSSGAEVKIFGEGGGRYLAEKYSLRLIEKLPIIPEISKICDQGEGRFPVKLHIF